MQLPEFQTLWYPALFIYKLQQIKACFRKAAFTNWHTTTSCSPFTAMSKVPFTIQSDLQKFKRRDFFHHFSFPRL